MERRERNLPFVSLPSLVAGHGALPLVALLAFSLIAWSPVHADTLDDVRSAIKLRDYERAAKLLLPLAEEGVADAQYQLAGLYRSGRGVAKNHDQAFYWLQEAALQATRSRRSFE